MSCCWCGPVMSSTVRPTLSCGAWSYSSREREPCVLDPCCRRGCAPAEVKFGPLALVVLMNFLKPGERMETQVPRDTARTRSPADSTT